MNTEKIKQIYLDFALEMLNKEIRDFVVYQAPPHIQELYTRLLTAFEESEQADTEAWFNSLKQQARTLDELDSPPTVYSWRSDNPYQNTDPIKADRWEQARMMLMKQRP